MIDILIVLAIILSLALIVLVTIQPRQNQLFSMDATSNIGKPSYWQSNTLVKVLTLLVSLALFVLLWLFVNCSGLKSAKLEKGQILSFLF
ncbi:accessory secretory protein Asp5 [Streptococcus pneumoniae]|nr:accessory secretory protein Asp5 [Streptococcus pneumoniae]